jgi:hypothetical protein
MAKQCKLDIEDMGFYTLLAQPHDLAHDLLPGYKFGEPRAVAAMALMTGLEVKGLSAANPFPGPPSAGGGTRPIQVGGAPPGPLTKEAINGVVKSIFDTLVAIHAGQTKFAELGLQLQTYIEEEASPFRGIISVRDPVALAEMPEYAKQALAEEIRAVAGTTPAQQKELFDRIEAVIAKVREVQSHQDEVSKMFKATVLKNYAIYRVQVLDTLKVPLAENVIAYDFLMDKGGLGELVEELSTDIALTSTVNALNPSARIGGAYSLTSQTPQLFVEGTRHVAVGGDEGFVFIILDTAHLQIMLAQPPHAPLEYTGNPVMINEEVVTSDRIRTYTYRATPHIIYLVFSTVLLGTHGDTVITYNSAAPYQILLSVAPAGAFNHTNLQIFDTFIASAVETLLWSEPTTPTGTVSYYDGLVGRQTILANYITATTFPGYFERAVSVNDDIMSRIGFLIKYVSQDGAKGAALLAAANQEISSNWWPITYPQLDQFDPTQIPAYGAEAGLLYASTLEIPAPQELRNDIVQRGYLQAIMREYQGVADEVTTLAEDDDEVLEPLPFNDPGKIQYVESLNAAEAQAAADRRREGLKRKGRDDSDEGPVVEDQYQGQGPQQRRRVRWGGQKGGGMSTVLFPPHADVVTALGEIAKAQMPESGAVSPSASGRPSRSRSPTRRSPTRDTGQGPAGIALLCGLGDTGQPIGPSIIQAMFGQGSVSPATAQPAKLASVNLDGIAATAQKGDFNGILGKMSKFKLVEKEDLNAKSKVCSLLENIHAVLGPWQVPADPAHPLPDDMATVFARLNGIFADADNDDYMREGVFASPKTKFGKQNFKVQTEFGTILSCFQMYVAWKAAVPLDDTNTAAMFRVVYHAIGEYGRGPCANWKTQLDANKSLTGNQKLNFTQIITACVKSVLFGFQLGGLNPLLSGAQGYVTNELDMMTKMVSPEIVRKMTAGKDIDKETYKQVLNSVKDPAQQGKFKGNSWYIDARRAPPRNLGDSGSPLLEYLKAGAGGVPPSKGLPALADKFSTYTNDGQGFYVNNAVSGAQFMGSVQAQKGLCSGPGLMDAMPTVCTTISSILKAPSEGVEWGDFDVMISDPGMNIVYRLAFGDYTMASGNKYPVKAKVRGYLQIGSEILMQIGAPGGQGSGMPGGVADGVYGPIEVDFTSQSGSPLQASNCLRELARTVISEPEITNWNEFNARIEANTAKGQALRRKILGVAHRKGLGDILQELISVIGNGGYKDGTWRTYGREAGIIPPDAGRLFMANDGPSGTRALFLILKGEGDMNPNCLGGFMGGGSGAFGAAFRSAAASGGGGRFARKRRPKKRRTRRKPKSKKATKKALLRKRQRRKRTRQNIRKKRNTKGKSRSSRSK